MFSSFTTAITSGTAITFALFYIMQLLISLQPGAHAEPRDRFELQWVRVPPPEAPPQTIDEKPPEIDPPAPLPEHVSQPQTESYSLGVTVKAAPPVSGKQLTGLESAFSDGPLVAMVRVEPTYPIAAAKKGLEGYVLVQFDVGADGTVGNAVVIESSNRIFERAALQAAKRFRFKPRVVDGVTQTTTGIQNLFRFEME